MGPGHFWWGMGGIFPFLLIIVIIIIILAIFRCIFYRRGHMPPWIESCHPHPPESGDPESAMEILKKRYARGEINKEEFEQIKKDITD
jgi:putative membrane protein